MRNDSFSLYALPLDCHVDWLTLLPRLCAFTFIELSLDSQDRASSIQWTARCTAQTSFTLEQWVSTTKRVFPVLYEVSRATTNSGNSRQCVQATIEKKSSKTWNTLRLSKSRQQLLIGPSCTLRHPYPLATSPPLEYTQQHGLWCRMRKRQAI